MRRRTKPHDPNRLKLRRAASWPDVIQVQPARSTVSAFSGSSPALTHSVGSLLHNSKPVTLSMRMRSKSASEASRKVFPALSGVLISGM